MKYGLFIGRFQPLHLGHMAVINEIIADGYTPVPIIGRPWDEHNRDLNKYPLTHLETAKQFHALGLLNGTAYHYTFDTPNNEYWAHNIKTDINFYKNEGDAVRLYYTNHPSDRDTDGVHYAEWFKNDVELKEATYPAKIGLNIRATDIRKDIEANKHYLDGRVYEQVKHIFR